jgi:hypothetical protein
MGLPKLEWGLYDPQTKKGIPKPKRGLLFWLFFSHVQIGLSHPKF